MMMRVRNCIKKGRDAGGMVMLSSSILYVVLGDDMPSTMMSGPAWMMTSTVMMILVQE